MQNSDDISINSVGQAALCLPQTTPHDVGQGIASAVVPVLIRLI